MPRHPAVAASTETLSSRVFSGLAARAAERRAQGQVVHSLHVGDTWQEPLPEARAEAQRTADHPLLHQYAPVQGEPELLDAIEAELARHRAVPRDRLQVVSGATSGLMVVTRALLDPGDEVLLPAPFWPLIRGIVASRGATPVQLPDLHALEPAELRRALEAAITDRTAMLYLNSPHNPTGAMWTDAQVDVAVEVANAHGLWLVCDEAYEAIYFGDAPTPIWTRDDVQDRYIACHTASKTYGLAGARVGWVHGAEAAMAAIRGCQTFLNYCAPRPMQHAVAAALRNGQTFLAERRALFGDAARRAANTLEMPAPPGGTFLFFDASPYLREGETTALPFLERCLDEGVLLTPGLASGEAYATWVRLCFTGIPLPQLDAALEALGPLLR